MARCIRTFGQQPLMIPGARLNPNLVIAVSQPYAARLGVRQLGDRLHYTIKEFFQIELAYDHL